MTKSPSETMIEAFDLLFEKAVVQIKESYEKLDSFIIWIIGFSTASIGFLVYQFYEKKHELISLQELQGIIVIFSISIVMGIVYRLFSYYLIHYFMKSFNQIAVMFRLQSNMTSISPTDEIPDDSIENLLNKLNNEFGVDITNHWEKYDKSADKAMAYKAYLIQYKTLRAWAIENQKRGIKYIEGVVSAGFGIDESAAKEFLNRKQDKTMWRTFLFKKSNYILNIPFYLSLIFLGLGYIVFIFFI